MILNYFYYHFLSSSRRNYFKNVHASAFDRYHNHTELSGLFRSFTLLSAVIQCKFKIRADVDVLKVRFEYVQLFQALITIF